MVKSKTHFALIRGLRGAVYFLDQLLPCFLVCSPLDCSFFLANQDGEPSMLPCHLFFSLPHPRGQGWFPVILALRLLLNIHIHKVISLLFCCDRVNGPWLSPERSWYKSHWLRKTVRVCAVCVCVGIHACVWSPFFFTSHHRIWRTFILPSWPRKCQRPR